MTNNQIVDRNDICKHCGAIECKEHRCKIYEVVEEVLANKTQDYDKLNAELHYWVNGDYCDTECDVVKELDQTKAELRMIQELKDEDSLRITNLATELKNSEARLGILTDEYINVCNIINFIEETVKVADNVGNRVINSDDIQRILDKIKEMN